MAEEAVGPVEAGAAIAHQELLRGLESAVDHVFGAMLEGSFDVAQLRGCARSQDDADAGQPPAPVISVEALVHIRGPLHGWIGLKCTARTAEAIARGLLLAPPEEVLGTEELEDAIGECANMIAGVLKTRLLDPRGAFVMSLPSLCTPQAPREESQGAVSYRLCSGALTAEVWLESEPEFR